MFKFVPDLPDFPHYDHFAFGMMVPLDSLLNVYVSAGFIKIIFF